MKYVFEIKNEKTSTYRLIRHIVIILNTIGLIYLIVIAPKDFRTFIWPGIAVFMCVFYLAIIFYERNVKDISSDTMHFYVLFFCARAWARFDFWWLMAAVIIIMILDYLVTRKFKVRFSEKNIVIPALFQTRLNWNDIHNSLLKDGMLTIDFKNNRLFQHEVMGSDVNEKQFNDFCRKQIVESQKTLVSV